MEFDDRNIVQDWLKLLNSSVQLNDGTNACTLPLVYTFFYKQRFFQLIVSVA